MNALLLMDLRSCCVCVWKRDTAPLSNVQRLVFLCTNVNSHRLFLREMLAKTDVDGIIIVYLTFAILNDCNYRNYFYH